MKKSACPRRSYPIQCPIFTKFLVCSKLHLVSMDLCSVLVPLLQERCMDNFLPWEVVPCRSGDWDSIYELDPQGEIYDNIYELRKVVKNTIVFVR